MPSFLNRQRRRKASHTGGFRGDFASWADAEANCKGYGQPSILEKTRAAIAEVRDGKAVFERDAVLLPHPERPYPLIACLLNAALRSCGRLSVLDFGGSLGSSYFQCRPFLTGIDDLHWAVVEQPHYVAVGRREFTSDVLSFHDTPEEACAVIQPDLLLLASVLPYVPDPHAILTRLLRLRISSIIVDRTPFLYSDRDRLTVQVVPPEIYPASYPAWFFGETRILAAFDRAGYRVAEDWPCVDTYSPDGDKAVYKGFLFVARESKVS